MRFASIFRLLACALTLLAALAAATPAVAQLRTLPVNAKRAELKPLQHPYIALDDKVLRLAPGAVMYDGNNRSILYGYLPRSADVVYQVDPTGHVIRLYILTPAEQDRLDRSRR